MVHALNASRYSFSQWVTCGNEMARNHLKHEFRHEGVDWAYSLWKNKNCFQGHKLMPCIHPDTRFRNGSHATMNWCETTPNLRFWPKEVDWACLLRKIRNSSVGTKSCLVSTPILVFPMGHVRQWNGAKPPHTRVLDLKKWIGHVHCKKTRNASRVTKSCLVSTPILVFGMGYVRQRNGARPQQTWLLDRKKWMGHVRCKKTRNGS